MEEPRRIDQEIGQADRTMALSAGDRLGHYAVTALVGEGGMGQVFRATDTKLGREVALKVLPRVFTDDPDRLARFEREAKVLASLNHPNIGSIYGLEEGGAIRASTGSGRPEGSAGTEERETVRALVLELVDGPTLADRIKQGPIPLDEALPIAKQVASALEAAHEAGIIHRDLKPANIKLRPDGAVKVLDFGLAKAVEPEAGNPAMSQSPTISLTAAATQMGMVMGTASYMAPEQAKGHPVDKRADLWAFGAVLFEMLTGQKSFTGRDVSETLAAVLRLDADLAALPRGTPPRARQVLKACLQKDPKDRLRDIGDASLALDGAFDQTDESAVSPSVRTGRASTAVGLALTAGLVIGGLAIWWLTRPPLPQVSRFVVNAPPSAPLAPTFGIDLALSPDGSRVVYTTGTPSQLYVRTATEVEGAVLAGTENGESPFFSPDGSWIGFFDSREQALKRIPTAGGPVSTVCETDGEVRGGSWGENDQIFFATTEPIGLLQVSAGGGEPEVLTTPDAQDGEVWHRWPQALPGTNALLFVASVMPDTRRIEILDLDTRERRVLIPLGTSPRYAGSGHIVYGTGESLRAAPFDLAGREVTGPAVTMVEGVRMNEGRGDVEFALSGEGSLVYSAARGEAIRNNTLAWIGRDGSEEPVDIEPGAYDDVQVSPNGMDVALDLDGDVWTFDTTRGTLNRVTTNPAEDRSPVWTPDGRRLVFESRRNGRWELFWVSADGSDVPELLLSPEENLVGIRPEGWTPDGTGLLFTEVRPGLVIDIGLLSTEGDGMADLLIQDGFRTFGATISPDGRWIAYNSDRSGQVEVYVQSFPDHGRLQLISTDGGFGPRWSRDGTELFYQSPDGRQLLTVPVTTDSDFSAGLPEVVFEGDEHLPPFGSNHPYDVSPDGQRFLMIKSPGGALRPDEAPPIILVDNWQVELARLARPN